MNRIINYSLDGYQKNLSVELSITDNVKISEADINKALMIAMNYLLENMETDKQEEPQ